MLVHEHNKIVMPELYKLRLQYSNTGMKKIVFVEKEEGGTYDPVSTFFASSKKPSSVAKPPAPKNESTKNWAQSDKPTAPKPVQSRQKKVAVEQKPVANKIGRKGDHLPYRKVEQKAKVEETVYNIEGVSQKHIKIAPTEDSNHQGIEASNNCNKQAAGLKNETSKINNLGKAATKQPTDCQGEAQISNLKRRIKQMEAMEQEYLRKLQQYEEKEEKLVKNEQRLQKLVKEQKQASTESKQIAKKLREKQEEMKKLLSKDTIPYNKKRQVLLQNQIASLKRINRELVTRIKNYRGTDLVEISLAKNKTDILFKDYDNSRAFNEDGVELQAQSNNLDVSKIESLAFRLNQQLQRYIQLRNSKCEMSWSEDRKFLADLNNYCRQLSFACLGVQFRLPASNEECVNIYNQIQKYRHALEPAISKHDLNFIITQHNIQLINRQSEEASQALELRDRTVGQWKAEPKKFKKVAEASAYYLNKLRVTASILEKNCNTNYIIVAHCLAQITYLKSWVAKTTDTLKQSLRGLEARMKEVEELVLLGEHGKESLHLYMTSNISAMLVRVPELNMQLREIGAIFARPRPDKR